MATCPEMPVDFMLIEHICICFIGALFARDWKSIYAMWCLYYLPSSVVFMHMFDTMLTIKFMVFAWNPIFAFAGAFLGEWVSVWYSFPRLFDLRGVRDAYARIYNWDSTLLIASVFAGYWSVMGFIGHLSGTISGMPECSMGLSRTQEIIVSAVAGAIAVTGLLAVVITALVSTTFDKVDRRLNLKYAFFMSLRMFIHYYYDMATMGMWTPPLVGGVYLALIVVYWLVAYFAFGHINVKEGGWNNRYLQYSNSPGNYPLMNSTIMDDRWSSIPQAQAFVLVASIMDVTMNVIMVIADQFSRFDNQPMIIAAGAALGIWLIVSALTPRVVYAMWSNTDLGPMTQSNATLAAGSVYRGVILSAKNMEIARMDLYDSPGSANQELHSGWRDRAQQTDHLIASHPPTSAANTGYSRVMQRYNATNAIKPSASVTS